MVEHTKLFISVVGGRVGSINGKTVGTGYDAEEFICSGHGFRGRPTQDRTAIARALVAKMGYNQTTTRALLDRLATDSALRRICSRGA